MVYEHPVLFQKEDLENDKLLQKIMLDHSAKKAAIQERQNFVKNMNSCGKMSKQMAFETEYDFYFQNNHGMFVVSSQLKYLDLIKVGKNKDILRLMRSVSDFKQ